MSKEQHEEHGQAERRAHTLEREDRGGEEEHKSLASQHTSRERGTDRTYAHATTHMCMMLRFLALAVRGHDISKTVLYSTEYSTQAK